MSKMRPITERDIRDEGVVGYVSVNDKTHTSFSAVTEPNSRHAARLARLAMSVQASQDEREQRNTKRKSTSAISWLPQIGPFHRTQPQLDYTTSATDRRSPSPPLHTRPSRSSHSSGSPTRELSDYYPDSRQTSTYSGVSSHDSTNRWPSDAGAPSSASYYPVDPAAPAYAQPAYDVYYVDDTTTAHSAAAAAAAEAVAAPEDRDREPRGTTVLSHRTSHSATSIKLSRTRTDDDYPEVTRYRTEHSTAYKVRGHNGRLQVSAPVGSNEAQLFDAIAEANSVEADRNGSKVGRHP